MAEYVLVARRPIRKGFLVRGVKHALYIPAGMQGQGGAYNRGELGQFRGKAGGYLQVEPAYERVVHGLGDFRQAVVGMIAGKELDQLTSAVHRLNDEVIRGISDRNSIVTGYKEAKALLDDAVKQFGQPMIQIPFGGSMPNPKVLPAYMAMATARKGVQILARQIQTLGMLDRVFTAISVELGKAGATNDANAIDVTLAQVRRFIIDTDNMVSPLTQDYMGTKRAIIVLAEKKYAAAGIDRNATDNPLWLGFYIQAANDVIPIPQSAPPAGTGLGNPMPALVAVLIWVVGIVAAAVVAAQAVSRLIPDQNSKAITAREILLDAAERKRQVELQMRSEGKSQAEIDAAKKSIDAEAEESVEKVPEPGSPFGALAIPIVIVAALGIGKASGVI